MTDLREHGAAIETEWPGDADDLLRRHKESLFPSVGLFYDEPIELRRGERQYVYDGAGRQYLDFFGGIATVSTGHAIPEINEPIKEQLDRIIHSSDALPDPLPDRAGRADAGDDAAAAEQGLLHQQRHRGERGRLPDHHPQPATPTS